MSHLGPEVTEEQERLFAGSRSTSPETAQRLMQGSLESNVDPRLGSEPMELRKRLSAQDIHLGVEQDPVGKRGRFIPADEPGVADETGVRHSTVQEATAAGFESAAQDVADAVPDVNLPEAPGQGAIAGAILTVGLVFTAIWALGQAAKGYGRGKAA